ncbi:hypothetical protein [Bradyrhizobium sp. DASA03120]|uniref:hypothetical protein n=1 Tax=Bradyrhizobium sp. SMVTL-02 TaxID=3395917 RepID=UPI003F6ED790
MSTTPSGNHESLKSKIPKRKKARYNTQLSCKIEYFTETNSVYLSGGSAFFTVDYRQPFTVRASPSVGGEIGPDLLDAACPDGA